MRVWLEMAKTKDGEAIAASEQLLLSVLQQEGAARAAPWRAETKAALDALAKSQTGMPHPPQAGAGIALKRK
jgi:hypothetical protein